MTEQSDTLDGQSQVAGASGIRRVIDALGQNRILIAIVLTFLLAGKSVSIIISMPIDALGLDRLLLILVLIAPIFLVSMIVWRFACLVTQARPAKPIHWMVKDFRDNLILDVDRVLGGVIAVLCAVLAISTLSFLKDSIPLLNPFSWDPTFARLDRVIHGGVDPYVLLAPVFGNPAMTKLADTFYNIWFSVIYFFVFIAAMDKEQPTRRNTFLIAFLLCWIFGGSILATVFSSAGPVYYQTFGYGDQFAPLLASLHEIGETLPLLALELHAALLDGYQNGGDVTGISAMPSMHLAMSWLIAFQAFRYHKILGWLMVAFAIMIQLSSVHLAWHYAIDGYAGLVIAFICWKAAKPLARLQNRFDRRPDAG